MDIVTNTEKAASAEVAKEVGFFEAHPKAIAIGSAVAGAILMFLVMHFL